ncbi:unnamed protein product [Urochloa decumbens]|uniref:F-box domain-containing protein n=1 Tax=Urochloa decumbens TaxID=240449 RepID=A0ABC8YP39_9POAL
MAEEAATETEGRTEGGAAALPEDVLFEIFSRVNTVSDLLRCALSCKPWRRLLTDRAFLRRLWPDQLGHGSHHRSRLLGFFFQQRRFVRRKKLMKARVKQHSSAFAPAFLPTPGSPLAGGCRDLAAFVADADGTFNYAQPLASRRGVVLVRLAPRDCFQRTATAGGLLLGLCNPVTGERHVAPPLETCACLGRHVNGYAILTGDDDDTGGGVDHLPRRRPSSPAFTRLLLTGLHQDDRHIHLHSYSAATRCWAGPTACLHGDKFRMAGAAAAVVHRGAAHWLYFDARRPQDERHDLYAPSAELVGTGTAARVSFTKLPVDAGWSPYLCVTGDGRLSIVGVRATSVEVWTRQDGDDADGDPAAWLWTRQAIRIPAAAQLVPECPSLLQSIHWFHLDKGAMVAVYNGDGAFVVDIAREVVEKVVDCSLSLGYFSCVPYEMDLPELFLLQLGGQ